MNSPWQNNKNRWLVKEYRIVGTMPFIKDEKEGGLINVNGINRLNDGINSINSNIDNENGQSDTVSDCTHTVPHSNDNSLSNCYTTGSDASISDLLLSVPIFYLIEFPSGRLNVGYSENGELLPQNDLEIRTVQAAHSIYHGNNIVGHKMNSSKMFMGNSSYKGSKSNYLKGDSSGYLKGDSSWHLTGDSSNYLNGDTSSNQQGMSYNGFSSTHAHNNVLNMFVMIEADRGLDCGRIISLVDSSEYKQLLSRIDKNLINKELHPKRMFRPANNIELKQLLLKKELEAFALRDCQNRVSHSNLNMCVTYCEYQFDMNKLTFFFESESKIDFRELVKALYKVFKVRIWMCAVDKSKNHHLRELGWRSNK